MYDGVYEMKNDEFNEVIKDAIYEYLENNPERDTVDIVAHLNTGQDRTLLALTELEEENRVKKIWTGLKKCYVVSE